jgi:hypothetical protein
LQLTEDKLIYAKKGEIALAGIFVVVAKTLN